MKLDLHDEMMRRKMDKKTRQGIYDFLKYYVGFQKHENFVIFEKEVETKLGRSDTMGTREYLLDKAEKRGLEKGMEKGLEKGERAKAIDIARDMKKDDLPLEQIAKFTKLSIKEIENLI